MAYLVHTLGLRNYGRAPSADHTHPPFAMRHNLHLGGCKRCRQLWKLLAVDFINMSHQLQPGETSNKLHTRPPSLQAVVVSSAHEKITGVSTLVLKGTDASNDTHHSYSLVCLEPVAAVLASKLHAHHQPAATHIYHRVPENTHSRQPQGASSCIIITRVSSQVHYAQSNNFTLVHDKQVTIRPPVTTTAQGADIRKQMATIL
jgi:hypothetical protein